MVFLILPGGIEKYHWEKIGEADVFIMDFQIYFALHHESI